VSCALVLRINVESYLKWIQFCHILLFLPSCCRNIFFTAPALLLRFTFFCVGIFIGNLPKTRYLLLAFYRYFRAILDSAIFLRPWWQPCLSFCFIFYLGLVRRRGIHLRKFIHLRLICGRFFDPILDLWTRVC